ncbi:nitronate monooxygenase [Streptoalloteichus tenebrarius]|uniref:Propionate 3-nitronate monooxygenase n=1 Tax=Streptoalloteichus tenebrarius (strain ATCC 17920 / DSM 40477 / JCM 4838 / CBS 697.72 / NBRC 16177 / NCIMB 11028 / NRRL B-12390 / A12253. 1 / ISP 5477) TaxID=1933 RepID=A0ABT1HZ66_STRSD|nr:nitronate monooxygenase [Streptoalloteichus tenebrarius]MCP2260826.1 nitronate monooxygenase [Streptoalloteichus tenebrarius]BFF00500.1 nitronate monooxygenase [Streptoalloteichus tenebrarius]
MINDVRIPIVAAPMAGGVSTPELVAAVTEAGAFGFLAAGYLRADALAEQITRTRALLGAGRSGRPAPFGVNLFVPGADSGADLASYRERLGAEARRYGVELGEPRWEDDDYPAKLELVLAERVPVVSFTFGCPDADVVRRVHEAGGQVVVTVTTPAEARVAVRAGADAVCVQGSEAGGHRAVFRDDGLSPGGGELFGTLGALRLVLAAVDVPVIAAGGLVRGADVAAVLTAGAAAAQLGTAFLRCPEAGTQPTQRAALTDAARGTALTRAFTGRPARGLVNRVMVEHSRHAPAAYPQLHHMTKPLRAAAGRADDPEAMSLWAGQTYALAEALPAGELVTRLHREAVEALDVARRRLGAR